MVVVSTLFLGDRKVPEPDGSGIERLSMPVHAFPVIDPDVLAIAVAVRLVCFVALCIIAGWI